MDPSESGVSLQKTSPLTDPAGLVHLSSELSAQATQLAQHHHQLQRLTTLTEELVHALHGLRVSADATPPNPPPNASPATVNHSINPRLALPEKFDGTAVKCRGFLHQCTLFVDQQPSMYPTDSSRIAFISSLLTGRALEWATAVWRPDGSAFPTFTNFLLQFRNVFEHPTECGDAGEQLLELTQGRRTAAEYSLSFRTLAAQTNWVEDTLKTLFRKGLSAELQSELACRDEGRGLDEYINLAIQIDNLIRSRRPNRYPPRLTRETSATPEPMQLGVTRLTQEERERRLQKHLCLYCGQTGHLRAACPVRPPNDPQSVSAIPKSSTLNSCFILPIRLLVRGKVIPTTALLD